MHRRLLKITALSSLVCAGLIALLFFFVDQPADLAARSLKGGLVYQSAAALSLLADHDLFNVLLTVGFLFLGVRGLAGGLTPGLRSLLYVCLTVTITIDYRRDGEMAFGPLPSGDALSTWAIRLFLTSLFGHAHSFPSGHNFRIFSAMTAFGLVWPRVRWRLLFLAGLVGVSRVLVVRHYPSDVLAGAFLGVFCALWVWRVMGSEPGASLKRFN